MHTDKWDYLFICSSRPSPRSIEKFSRTCGRAKNPAMIYIERKRSGGEVGEFNVDHIPGSSILVYNASFRSAGPRRIIALCAFIIYIIKNIRPNCASPSGQKLQVYCDALDILVAFRIALFGRSCTYRLEAADLNALQLDPGFIPATWRFLERRLIRCVSMLVLTSSEFHPAYYSRIYSGKFTVIENWPDAEVWKGFSRSPSKGVFLIGYVGSLRYLGCLYALIDAVSILRKKGININIRFAGGGEVEKVRNYCDQKEVPAEITGAFTYSTDVRDLYSDIHLSYSVYDTKYMNVRCAMPNKFYECYHTGIPILVASGTYLARRVAEAGIGGDVECNSSSAIAAVLEQAVNGAEWYSNAKQRLADSQVDPREQLDKSMDYALFG